MNKKYSNKLNYEPITTKFIQLSIIILFSFLIISKSYGQYYPVPNSKLELQNKKSFEQVEVQSFLISNFITVHEFKMNLLI